MAYRWTLLCISLTIGQTLCQFAPQAQPTNLQPQQGGFPAQNPAMQPQPGGFQNQNSNPAQNSAMQPAPTFNQAQAGSVPVSQQQPGTVNQNVNAVPAQAPGTSNEDTSQFTCAQAGRMAVAQCFQQNGGFQMVNVIALLSNGTQGQLPANSDQVKTQLCQAENQINSCVFNSIIRFNGTQQCNTLGSFIKLQQETVGLLNGIQQLCGTGILPKVTMCMRRLSYDMMQCYEKVGLNPSLYAPGGSRLEGAVIGDNREAAKMFCSKKQDLFNCQNDVLENCPKAKDLQELSGNDQKSMQNGMEVLCKDVDDYVSGLVCFQQPTRAVQSCASDLVRDMTDVTMKQIREGLSTDGFFTEYCRARIRNLMCDNAAWADVCEPVSVGLKSEFQCNLLPTRCKNDPKVRDLYNKVCTVSSYARNLRNPDSGAASTLAGITTLVMTTFVGVLLTIF